MTHPKITNIDWTAWDGTAQRVNDLMRLSEDAVEEARVRSARRASRQDERASELAAKYRLDSTPRSKGL